MLACDQVVPDSIISTVLSTDTWFAFRKALFWVGFGIYYTVCRKGRSILNDHCDIACLLLLFGISLLSGDLDQPRELEEGRLCCSRTVMKTVHDMKQIQFCGGFVVSCQDLPSDSTLVHIADCVYFVKRGFAVRGISAASWWT